MCEQDYENKKLVITKFSFFFCKRETQKNDFQRKIHDVWFLFLTPVISSDRLLRNKLISCGDWYLHGALKYGIYIWEFK